MSNIAQLIKYEGDNSTFVWKHPCEDFNSLTQLIVHESQEAIFFMNGKALDTFGPGRYTLETENIPKLSKFINSIVQGKETPFHCEVYFINKTVQMAIKWGTDSKIRYIDPKSGLPLELGASGEMNMQVANGRKLLVKLVGTTNGIAWGENGANFTKSVQNSFRPLIATTVKSYLPTAIKANKIDILEVDEHLAELSESLKANIVSGFEEYGLTIPEFYLTTVVLPEEDPNFRHLKELHAVALQKRMAEAEAEVRTAQAKAKADITIAEREAEMERQATETAIARHEAERRLIEAQAEAEAQKMAGFAEAEIMREKGYTEKDVIQAEVQKAFAEGMGNMGSNGGAGGSTMSDIVGLGVGLQAAGAMGSQVGNIFAGFAGQNNQPAAAPTDDTATFKAKIEKLTMMKDAGLLTDEEFNNMKAELLKSIL